MLTYRPGTVVGGVPQKNIFDGKPMTVKSPAKMPTPKENNTPRAINYFADYSGCGFWRMLWPEHLLTAYQKVIVHGSTCMVRDPGYYNTVKSVRLQRQANPAQLKFYEYLRQLADKNSFPVIYEIDDIVFREDIPNYNKYKFAFMPDEIRDSTLQMMRMSDEMTCTCQFMKDYYQEKTGKKEVTIIPNYPPRFWLDGFYDEKKLQINYDKNVKKRKRPRILYAGSGAHFDVDNKTGQQDDFAHVRDVVRKTANKYQWIFIGAYPPPLHDLVQSGKIEFHTWKQLYDLPRFINSLQVQAMVAPLINNTFNKAKSNIKYIEACAYGLPVICQDMITYKDAPLKFTTGDEMIDQIATTIQDKQTYMKICRKARQNIHGMWLEDHIDEYVELYCHPYGSPERVKLNKINGIK